VIKALLVGCGNMGGGYDLEDPGKVWTHAKAYSLRKNIELTVFDEDKARARRLADEYNANVLPELNEENCRAYHLVSIATPTTTHFNYLEKVLKCKVPVVICEKPVVSEANETHQLEKLYQSSTSKVLVNYIRRFQPGYNTAKERILQLQKQQSPRGFIVKYRRGFLNNASHAVDLLEFIFESPFDFKNFQCTSAEFDAFEYDPTLTGSCLYLDCPVGFVGIANTSYAIFEIELFFSSSKVVICHSGNEIRYYYDDNGNWSERFNERQTALLDAYMLPVVDEAINLYNGNGKDNFISSLHLNKAMLNIIESLKKKSNASISN
jgi:hypothetical protein